MLWIVGVIGITILAAAVVGMWRAELDEKRWRRKLDEDRIAALIRERRYGPKGGKR